MALFDPTSDAGSPFLQAAMPSRPHLLLSQSPMEPFNIAVAFRVVRRGSPMHDVQLRKHFHERCRREACAIVRLQCQICFAASRGQAVKFGSFHRRKSFRCLATARQVPFRDFPCAAVDHLDQVRLAQLRAGPHLGHARLPDMIRCSGFDATHCFFRRGRSRRDPTSKRRSRIIHRTRLQFPQGFSRHCIDQAMRR